MFDFLQRREILDIILSAEVVFSAIFTLALFIVVHSLLTFMRQSTSLYGRLAHIEADLVVLQASIPGKLERISCMRRELAPLQDRFKRIQMYHARLQYAERKWMEEQVAAEREAEEQSERQIQRQRLGLDRFI